MAFFCYFTVTFVKTGSATTTRSIASASMPCGGALGAILTGVFAINQYGGTPGLIEGNAGQVVNQLIGVGTVIAYDVIVSAIILFLIKITIGLRVSPEIERDGLDLALHGEVVQ